MTELEQIDRNISIPDTLESRKKSKSSRKKIASGVVWILSALALILIVILILPSGGSNSFNTDFSSEEQEIRSVMSSIAFEIHEYTRLNGRPPRIPEDIDIPLHAVTYSEEGDSSWLLQSGDSIVYYSDMDLVAFEKGEI